MDEPRSLPAPFRALASLRLTVSLLGLGIFLTLAGTLAQREAGIWSVLDGYFRTLYTLIPLRIFFPSSMHVPGVFPFPGGFAIGGLLLVNLLLAHAIRFKVTATGRNKVVGMVVTALGLGLLSMVILGYFTQEVSATENAAFWRVLWRLIHGGLGAAVLLVGFHFLFGRQGGIVLLHCGVIIMLLSEFITALCAQEGQMRIQEGGHSNYVTDLRSSELVFIRDVNAEEEEIISIPQSLLKEGATLSQEVLPCRVETLKFFVNSELTRTVDPGAPGGNLATKGLGLRAIATPRPEVSGIDPNQRVDTPSVYIKLSTKSGEVLGTYLCSTVIADQFSQIIEIDGVEYDLRLRLKRVYKAYEIHLVDFRHDKYIGTETPSNYSSEVRLVDPDRQVDRKVKIWMNNPLRYGGETFYQSSFVGSTITELQVVKNQGWMGPYVACMVVFMGMSYHFLFSLSKFMRRRLKS